MIKSLAQSLVKKFTILAVLYAVISFLGAIVSSKRNPHHPLEGIWKILMIFTMAITSPLSFWKGLFK